MMRLPVAVRSSISTIPGRNLEYRHSHRHVRSNRFEGLSAPIRKQHRLSRRRSVPPPPLPFAAAEAPLMSPPPGRTIRNFRLAAPEFRSAVDHHVLHRFALVHALVGNEGEIVFFASRTSKYPEMPTGAATRHLLAHCRRDIPLDLQTMLREAIETRKRVRRERLRVDIGNGNVQRVSLTAEPFNGKSAAEPLYTIVFDDEGAVVSREDAMVLLENNRLDASPQVERDLGDTRERPQSLVDECETAMEELISFNEFGRELIEKPLSHTLDARATLAFGADGIVCTIGIPYAAAEAETPAQSLETQ